MIPRSEIIGRLRQMNYSYSKKGKRTDILRQHGTAQHVAVPLRDLFTPDEARVILRLAGCTSAQIDQFLADCLKG
jgi:hypothetical protein